jgi:acyl-CoA thioesterase-1
LQKQEDNINTRDMKKLKTILLFCLLSTWIPQASAQAGLMPTLLVTVYGDRLTANTNLQKRQRFAVKLEQKMRGIGFDVEVKYVGDPDITSAEALGGLSYLIGMSPDVVILQLGRSDMERRLSTQAFNSNLTTIIDILKKKNIYVIVMGAVSPDINGETYNQSLDVIYKTIKSKTSFYPHPLFNISNHPELTTADGNHPNADGVEVMVEGIYRMVDAGLRWRFEIINQLRASQRQLMQ